MLSSGVCLISGNKMPAVDYTSEGFVSIEGFDIFYRQYKPAEYHTKPVLIFLHEGLGTTDSWGFFAYELAERLGLPALLYDRRGYGRSSRHKWVGNSNYLHEEAELLNTLIKYFNINKPIVFGHSDGASIALIYGGLFTRNAVAIISVAAHTFLEKHTYLGVKKAIELFENTQFKDKLSKLHRDKTDDVFYSWALTWTDKSTESWDIFEELEKIRCPILVIQGENDQYGTGKQVMSIIKRNINNSESFIFADCGHIPYKEKKEEMLEKCGDFIKSSVLDKIKNAL